MRTEARPAVNNQKTAAKGASPPTVVVLPPNPLAIRDALGTLRVQWAAQGLPQDVGDTAELVLAEILNNVAEHAMPHPERGEIQVRSRVLECGLACEIHDDGLPMPSGRLPDPPAPALGKSVADLPEGGFGWVLIRLLTEDLGYSRRDGWNRLRFRISADSDNTAPKAL